MILVRRKGEAGYTHLALANLNYFGTHWGIKAAPSCLLLGPRAMGAGVQWPECENPSGY